MGPGGFPVITPLGRMHLRADMRTRVMCVDFGVTMDTLRVLGPYVVMVPMLEPASASLLAPRALRDCYVAAHGVLLHCSELAYLCAPMTRIFAVLRARRRYVLCCDDYDVLRTHVGGSAFSVRRFTDTDFERVRVLELYNYNYGGEYQLVLLPSVRLLRQLQSCATYCLDDGHGWLAVDACECPLSRFRFALPSPSPRADAPPATPPAAWPLEQSQTPEATLSAPAPPKLK
ncbi:MC145 [Molluscum contagiosum virus subtype 2]|uniref:MC145 n=2 Tax=Molluscum contagiosum virus TaxID=10279 RepID=A0A1S7DMG4_MCV2|nr:MC145 [Molluscum contagiosum virus subtype 2]QHW16534.1 MC145R [Molluscum contagiosum virus]AYO87779.1 MC145 [Molluscum contagiosum virus subtype 2]AYO87949.1 MC145 [Molluscum contagiosum virus subtype 2]AYO88119.1 MC145 [Molluscum contagiosum virus subtype 2]